VVCVVEQPCEPPPPKKITETPLPVRALAGIKPRVAVAVWSKVTLDRYSDPVRVIYVAVDRCAGIRDAEPLLRCLRSS